jgi:hypothetical protein
VVECSGLENRRTGNRSVSSNLTHAVVLDPRLGTYPLRHLVFGELRAFFDKSAIAAVMSGRPTYVES